MNKCLNKRTRKYISFACFINTDDKLALRSPDSRKAGITDIPRLHHGRLQTRSAFTSDNVFFGNGRSDRSEAERGDICKRRAKYMFQDGFKIHVSEAEAVVMKEKIIFHYLKSGLVYPMRKSNRE
jgi:hypothetical protein